MCCIILCLQTVHDFKLLTVDLETQSLQQSLMSVKLSNSTFQKGGCTVPVTFLSHSKYPGPADSFLRANNLLLSAGSSQLEQSL